MKPPHVINHLRKITQMQYNIKGFLSAIPTCARLGQLWFIKTEKLNPRRTNSYQWVSYSNSVTTASLRDGHQNYLCILCCTIYKNDGTLSAKVVLCVKIYRCTFPMQEIDDYRLMFGYLISYVWRAFDYSPGKYVCCTFDINDSLIIV